MRITLTVLVLLVTTQVRSSPYVLWYETPAANGMNEALPIGNGRVGGLVYGAAELDRVAINEISLWTGNDNPSLKYGSKEYGDYQTLGSLQVSLPTHKTYTRYRRALDIGEAVSSVEYESNGVHYRRDHFVSHEQNVLVAQYSADKKGSYSGKVELVDSHQNVPVVTNSSIMITSALDNGEKYAWQLFVHNTGGSLKVNGTGIEFQNCDSLTILISAGTDYVTDSKKKFKGEDPTARVRSSVSIASKKSAQDLKVAHIRDHQSLFNRVDFDLGQSSDQQKGLPTNKRKVSAYDHFDPDFEEMFFQYGRYLLISSSRGYLPANLQGLWNDVNNPPWHADYHADINVQMNYWPAETTNLAECHVPLFDLIRSQLDSWRQKTHTTNLIKTPEGKHSSKGVSCAGQHNIYGGMGIYIADGKPFWDKTTTAWYAQHFFWHYEFGRNKTFLQNVAYPFMKEVVEFWDEMLKKLPNGQYVVPLGWSPEHGPVEDGPSYNQEIVWDLLTNFVSAADALGVDKELRNRMAPIRDKLHVPGVGSFGQLLEWMEEQKGEATDHHRHTSHLFGVYPGRQINWVSTPNLTKAAIVSLEHRGWDPSSDVREWSFAWRTGLYARLRDGEKAYLMLRQLYQNRNSCPNLFGLHPPLQIDGNFGSTASTAEMILHSHNYPELEVLPALPKEWKSGHMKGLRARGGFETDIEWKDGKLDRVQIKGKEGSGEVTIRYGNQTKKVHVDMGKVVNVDDLDKMTILAKDSFRIPSEHLKNE